MPLLNITKTYADTQILSEADLDNILNSVETFVNTTKLDSTNIQAGGIATANLAANSVTAAKLDETDDYEMESLLLGDVDGPTLSKADTDSLLVNAQLQIDNTTDGPILSRAAADTLLIDDIIQLDNSTDGPLLSRSAADRLLVADSLQLETSVDGPILSRGAANRLTVEDQVQVGATGPVLFATGTDLSVSGDTIRLGNNAAGAIASLTDGIVRIEDSAASIQGNIVIDGLQGGTSVGYQILNGSGTIGGGGSVSVSLPVNMLDTSYRVAVTYTSSPTGPAWAVNKSTSGFQVNGTANATFDWIAYGRYV